MTQQKLIDQLSDLLSLPGETEVVEFKEAKTNYDFRKFGKLYTWFS